MGGRKGGGGKVGGSLELGASLKVDPVFLAASNSLRPLPPQFKAISSSSSDDLSGQATISIGAWTLKCLSDLPSVSESKRNLSIYSSSEEFEEAISSPIATTAGRT